MFLFLFCFFFSSPSGTWWEGPASSWAHVVWYRLSQCLLFGRWVVGVGVLVEGREQWLHRRLGGGGRRLLQRAEVCGGVRRWGAVTGVGGASTQGGGGGGWEPPQACGGVQEGLVVKKEGTLVDEGVNDCLIGSGGSQRVHGGEVGPHECGPEADGQIITGHQVHPIQLAHSGNTHKHTYLCQISLFLLNLSAPYSTTVYMSIF